MSSQVCQGCGSELTGDPRFCPTCGKEATPPVCQNCEAAVIDGARFCQNCGQEVGVRVCQNCGEKVIEGARFCQKCGQETALPHLPGQQSNYPVPSAKTSALLHPSFGLRLMSGIVIVAIVLFFWLGLPLIKKGMSNDTTTTGTTTTGTTTTGTTTTGTTTTGTTTTGTTTTGTTTTGTTSTGAPWPDVPLYAGARPAEGDWASMADSFSSAVPGMKTEWHFYRVNDSDLTSAISFYKSKLPGTSWQYLTDASDPTSGAVTAIFMKGSEMLIVMTIKDPGSNTGYILGLCRGKT